MDERGGTLPRLKLAGGLQLVGAVAALLAASAHAQDAPTEAEALACAPHAFRWQDGCQSLGNHLDEVSGVDRLRYIPLTSSGSVWMTLGGQVRFKSESLDAVAFGINQAPSYTTEGLRLLGNIDLRTTQGARVFVELSTDAETGRKPIERTIDRGEVDVAQAFVDLPLAVGSTQMRLRAGRQELDFDSNRLVAVRDASNQRRSFDLLLLHADHGAYSLEAFAGHPALNRPGAFNDEATPGEDFWGVRAWLQEGDSASNDHLEVFYFARRRDRAVFQDAVGRELRRDYGLRWSGHDRGFDYAVQASLQSGDVASSEIHAYGVAADLGYVLGHLPWSPRLGLSAGACSGDGRTGDRRLGTFDGFYPNLSYFTDAPLITPGNDWDVQPHLGLRFGPEVGLQTGTELLYRVRRTDAVYQPPGIPLVPGNGQGGSFITALSFLKVIWAITPRVDVSGSYVHGDIGSLIKAHGGRDADYGFVSLSLRL